MQRSATQVLFRHLPGSVFAHEDEFIAQVHHVKGDAVHGLNKRNLLEELAQELARWDTAHVPLPDPARFPNEYVVLEPELVKWDVYPLTFECVNPSCGVVRRWFRQDALVTDTATTGLRCKCGAKMRQLRYVTAHNCGHMEPLFTPRCPNCNRTDDVYLEDLGSFVSSTWKCRNCNGVVQATRFTPCSCGEYAAAGKRSYQRGFTTRDSRLWFPHTLTIINFSATAYDELQRHPDRGTAALASWLGDETNIRTTLLQLDRSEPTQRFTEEEWVLKEAQLRAMGLDDTTIAGVRASQGPATGGVAATAGAATSAVTEHMAARVFVERAGLFDRTLVTDRVSVDDLARDAAGDPVATASLTTVTATMARLGVADLSVTQKFPIVLASYGYTRVTQDPERSHLRGYATTGQYDGKNPIFAVPAETEALLLTMSARAVIGFLAADGRWDAGVPATERDARLVLMETLARNPDAGGDDAAGVTRRLVHSASHALVRSLDDGETGFGESSLAEWIVTDALTTAIYVAAYNDTTLGAFDTVLHRRVTPWLRRAADAMNSCDNDPLCAQQRPHAACDRCLHLSFGCRMWNADLDRKLLRRFWRWTQSQR